MAGLNRRVHVQFEDGKARFAELPPHVVSKIEQSVPVSRALGNIEVRSNERYQKGVENVVDELV